MIPLMVEILVQLLLLAGAAAITFLPFWLYRARRGNARFGLLESSAERQGSSPSTPKSAGRRQGIPAASLRR